ncbi:MAG: hypothetical protein A2659_02225 [Candidatus Yanofskybacteria bacterium RIFCSPHIGHO2_01_FULL_44_24]|nr:MAG: hypothetical protein A2659_02225 [Candidatus Yanofskybacteria bacterium RIFCSPHIGHO2_01_FULL_44_24]
MRRFRPEIIAVTGNVGKTSTKEAIAAVLKNTGRIRASRGNLNNELGVPLTILGDWSDEYYESGNTAWFWIKVLFVGTFGLFFQKNYPKILVLEYGADKPGDIKKLSRRFKPSIGIVTAVGKIPVHVEYFSDPDGVAREKSHLVSGLSASNYAILNQDDPAVSSMRSKTKAKVMTYGFGEGSTVQVFGFDNHYEKGKLAGVSFKLHYGANSFIPVTIQGALGRSQALSAAAAASVGIIKEMNLIEIADALSENYNPPKGRLRLLEGIKNSTIIDDTYNAAPASTHLAVDILKLLPLQEVQGKPARKIAVLGDMLELGKYTVQAHQEIGNLVGGQVDELVCVGLRAKFIADAAANQMPAEKIRVFATSLDARSMVQEMIRAGDTILVKGSQGIRMEKIVEEIMAEPERKKELLVRQGKKWLRK